MTGLFNQPDNKISAKSGYPFITERIRNKAVATFFLIGNTDHHKRIALSISLLKVSYDATQLSN